MGIVWKVLYSIFLLSFMKKLMLLTILGLMVFGVGVVGAIECSEADYDGDGDVDFMDVLQLRQCINISVSEVDAVNCSFFDYDGSGMVEENDLVKYREWNLKTCPVVVSAEYYLVTDDEAPVEDVLKLNKIADGVLGGYDFVRALNSEITRDVLEDSLVVFLSGEKAIIIVDKSAPVSDSLLAAEISSSLESLDVSTIIIKNTEITSDDLMVAIAQFDFEKVVSCTDSDGRDEFTVGNVYAAEKDYPVLKQRFHDVCVDTNPLGGQVLEYLCGSDGYLDKEYIDCSNGCSAGACVKGDPIDEKITCVFKNSDGEQECYLAGQFGPEDEGTKFCRGEKSCSIEFSGYSGEEITWKSTCGEYRYTKQDGEDEEIEFDCKVGKTTQGQIKNKGFSNVYFECYDGETSRSIDRRACKSSEFWQKFAQNFCKGHCYEDNSKCGVNSFSVWDECYLDVDNISVVEEGVTETEIGLVCKDSCPLDGKCYPFGYRKSREYCSDEEGFIEQKSGEETCENSFECDSNLCIDGECVSAGFFRRIMNWFARWFS